MYGGYKSGRRAMPEELRQQMEPVKALLSALGVTVLSKEGFEADDFLGSLSALAEEAGMPSYLLTGDRDSLQLLSDKTSVLLLKTGQTALFTPEKFQETYGVPASHYLDVKALMGDSSDAIPGIPGVGEKTALRLIAEYGTLDRLYAAMDEAGEKGDTKKLPAISPSLFTKLIGDGKAPIFPIPSPRSSGMSPWKGDLTPCGGRRRRRRSFGGCSRPLNSRDFSSGSD